MASAHQSDSAERTAETYALEAVGEKIGVGLRPRKLTLPDGAGVELDGVADGDPAILAEVYAHQGRLKGGQFHKLLADAFKLVATRRLLSVDDRLDPEESAHRGVRREVAKFREVA